MSSPKISVVMSVFKPQKEWLKLSISSILEQTFSDLELIVINDFPGDSALDKTLLTYKKSDGRVVLVKNQNNIGLTRSLNIGLKLARGKYIARMDADDISYRNRIKKQFDYLESNNSVFLIGSQIDLIDENGRMIGKKNLPIDYLKIMAILKKKNCLSHPSIMFRKDGLTYREKFYYAQDYDFYLRLISQGKVIVNHPESLLSFRFSDNSISSSKFKQQVYFAYFAKKFYQQRISSGKDNYVKFNNHSILNSKIFIPEAELMFFKKKIGKFFNL